MATSRRAFYSKLSFQDAANIATNAGYKPVEQIYNQKTHQYVIFAVPGLARYFINEKSRRYV